jgi:hypothetical protein
MLTMKSKRFCFRAYRVKLAVQLIIAVGGALLLSGKAFAYAGGVVRHVIEQAFAR